MRYRVTTPVPDYRGSVGDVHFAAGEAVVDGDANPAEMAYFRARGYGIEEIAEDAGTADVDESDPESPGPETPKKSASTEAWRAYAVAAGEMTEDEAGQMSRDELVEYFTTEETPS
jgi:hypothetical protein